MTLFQGWCGLYIKVCIKIKSDKVWECILKTIIKYTIQIQVFYHIFVVGFAELFWFERIFQVIFLWYLQWSKNRFQWHIPLGLMKGLKVIMKKGGIRTFIYQWSQKAPGDEVLLAQTTHFIYCDKNRFIVVDYLFVLFVLRMHVFWNFTTESFLSTPQNVFTNAHVLTRKLKFKTKVEVKHYYR